MYREGNHFLYICDTKNHSIREINLTTKEVLTVIGTGEKGFDKEGNKIKIDNKFEGNIN